VLAAAGAPVVSDVLLDSAPILDIGELLWGIALIAVTMALHAAAMPATRSAAARLWTRWPPHRGPFGGVPVLVVASWMIVLAHLVEVIVWSAFLLWRGALGNAPDAFYFALCQYVTVGSDLSLPDRWRLVGGMISMAGLLTFAWSTAVLLTLVQRLEDTPLSQRRGGRHPPEPAQTPHPRRGQDPG
jgi:hypothetical protein